MNRFLSRAAAFAALSTVSLAVAVSVWGTVAIFLSIAVLGALLPAGRLFDALSTAVDVQDGRLRTLVSFALTGGALAALIPAVELPPPVYVTTMLTVGYGDLGRRAVERVRRGAVSSTAGFVFAGGAAGIVGQLVLGALTGGATGSSHVLFVAASGAFLGALLRSVLVARNDPLVLGFLTLFLWLLFDLAVGVSWTPVFVALLVSFLFGWLSISLETASIPGMLTGVFLSLLAVVLGGYGWFVVLIAFFGIGGLATKFRYEQKVARGVAEANEGARGTGNVLGNSLAALVALLFFAAHPRLPVSSVVLVYAFAGSVATALADTLSSEIGGLFDDPRLLTTFERVEPGTDGAVTWQGEFAGLAGAALTGLLAVGFLPISPIGVAVIVLSGLIGMTVDSLAGATIEGQYVGNQTVNFLATSAGGVAGALVSLLVV
ncbi:MAG: TIGR00297 family protein [Halodesulfurarchaeum sp.]